ncbi:hypothetical protein SAMN05216376_1075 [Mameliella alba]|nr:hypothetical protein LX94_02282 [Mameliella alba]SDD22951.1 hypothetical protein SAMN05216376_1075 [Mameliella alba]
MSPSKRATRSTCRPGCEVGGMNPALRIRRGPRRDAGAFSFEGYPRSDGQRYREVRGLPGRLKRLFTLGPIRARGRCAACGAALRLVASMAALRSSAFGHREIEGPGEPDRRKGVEWLSFLRQKQTRAGRGFRGFHGCNSLIRIGSILNPDFLRAVSDHARHPKCVLTDHQTQLPGRLQAFPGQEIDLGARIAAMSPNI